jgi:hypothetical protein
MKMDYKEYYTPIYAYDEEVAKCLAEDAPKEKLTNMINYIMDHAWYESDEFLSKDWEWPGGHDSIVNFNKYPDDKLPDEYIYSFCKENEEYEYWAQLVLGFLEFKQKRGILIRNKYTAENLQLIFEYYHEKSEPLQALKEMKDKTLNNNVIRSKVQEKSLIEVVNGLPEYDKDSFNQDFPKVWKAIDEWLQYENAKWEKNLLTEIPRDKFGLYFLNKVKDILYEFEDYLPETMESWEEMKTEKEAAYYCMAIENYLYAVCRALDHFEIEEDRYVKKIYDLAWFFFDDDDMDESEKENEENHIDNNANNHYSTNAIKGHDQTLLDVVNKLPKYDKNIDIKNFQVVYKALDSWLKAEYKIWENDIVTKIPKDKIGMYFYGKMTNLLASFHNYIPQTDKDWDNMLNGSNYFYCIAMEEYYFNIFRIMMQYNIKEDEYISDMRKMCWFFSDTNDIFDSINPADSQINDATECINSHNTDSYNTGKIFSLPDDINTEHVYDCINKAIDANYISIIDNNHLEWLGNNGNKILAHLAYFCGVIFGYNKDGSCNGNAGNHVPYKALEDLFNVKRLDRALSQVHEAKKPQVWRKKYDDLLK